MTPRPKTVTVTGAMMLAALAILAACGDRGSRAEGPWEFRAGSGPGIRPAAWLRTGGEGRQSLRQGSVEVEMTLDTELSRRISGFAGTTGNSGQVVLTVSLDSVLALLAGHRRATVDYEDGAGSSRTTAVFPIAGLEARRAEFVAACDRVGGDRTRPPR